MRAHERLELGHERGVTPQGGVRVDAILERGDPQLREPGGLRRGERLVREVRERRSAPHAKPLRQRCGGALGLARREQAPPRVGRALEPVDVDLIRRCSEQVAMPARDDRPGAERLA